MVGGGNFARAQRTIGYLNQLLHGQANVFTAAADDAGELVRNEVVKELSHPGTGKVYGRHRASSPGSPPAVNTGTLRNSIFVRTVSVSTTHRQIEVGTRVKYAGYLEYGTSRMRPRPFMRTAVLRAQPQITSMTTAKVSIHLP